MAKKKNTIPKSETKREKFKRVVTPRVNKAIKVIGLVGNQAGAAYEYTDDDVTYIIEALHDAVEIVENKYRGKGSADAGFKLR